MTIKPKYKYVCQFCKNVSFYLTKKPESGQLILAQDVILLDGKKPTSGDRIICGACQFGLPTLYTINVFANKNKCLTIT